MINLSCDAHIFNDIRSLYLLSRCRRRLQDPRCVWRLGDLSPLKRYVFYSTTLSLFRNYRSTYGLARYAAHVEQCRPNTILLIIRQCRSCGRRPSTRPSTFAAGSRVSQQSKTFFNSDSFYSNTHNQKRYNHNF